MFIIRILGYNGYAFFLFPDVVCRDIPENKRFHAACNTFWWMEKGKRVSEETAESYITYMRQNRAVWLRKTSLSENAMPAYRVLLREKILNGEEAEKLAANAEGKGFSELAAAARDYAEKYVPDSAGTAENAGKENDAGGRWQVSKDGHSVIALEEAGADVVFPTEINGQKITAVGDGFTFIAEGKNARSKVKSVVVPEGYLRIGSEAFKDCSQMKKIELPDTIETIGEGAFNGCGKIAELKIPEGLKEIGDRAFGSASVKKVRVSSMEKWLSIRWPGQSSNPLGQQSLLMIAGRTIRKLEFPDGLEEIPDYSFQGYGGLTDVCFPAELKRIGRGAFEGCTGLTRIVIPAGVKEIGAGAFLWDTGLQEIIISGPETKIGPTAFGFCEDVEYAEYHEQNPVEEEEQLPLDGTAVRRLVIRGLDETFFWNRETLGSLGSVVYLEKQASPEAPGSVGNDTTRPIGMLESDRKDPEDAVCLKGLTFVADGDMGMFPEPPEFYKPEYEYYNYKDWKETGDVFEGYREIKNTRRTRT